MNKLEPFRRSALAGVTAMVGGAIMRAMAGEATMLDLYLGSAIFAVFPSLLSSQGGGLTDVLIAVAGLLTTASVGACIGVLVAGISSRFTERSGVPVAATIVTAAVLQVAFRQIVVG